MDRLSRAELATAMQLSFKTGIIQGTCAVDAVHLHGAFHF